MRCRHVVLFEACTCLNTIGDQALTPNDPLLLLISSPLLAGNGLLLAILATNPAQETLAKIVANDSATSSKHWHCHKHHALKEFISTLLFKVVSLFRRQKKSPGLLAILLESANHSSSPYGLQPTSQGEQTLVNRNVESSLRLDPVLEL